MTIIALKTKTTLIEATRQDLAKAKECMETAELFYKSAGQKLKQLKLEKPTGITWEKYVRDEFDLSRQRADELIRIAEGKTTVKKTRETKRNSVRQTRKRLLRSSHSKREKKLINPKPERPEVIWRRGLISRCNYAIGDSKFEDWSMFKVDKHLVSLAKQAADGWKKLAIYLEKLL